MKFLIVLCAALACASAKPQLLLGSHLGHPLAYSAAYASPLGHPIAYGYGSPALAYSTHTVAASPAVAYSAPAVAYSAPAVAAAPVIAAPAVAYAAAPLAAKSQYHAQDELGQASYGHSEPGQTHNAVQDAFGNKVGSFSYASPDGRILRTDYVADALGYRVASNALPAAPAALPLPVQDTPEVAIAKAQHLAEVAAAHHRIAKRHAVLVQTPASTAPLATAVAAAPIAYSAPIAHPLAYSAHHAIAAPLAYSAAPVAAPLAYSAAHIASPLAYSAHHAVAAPLAYSAAPVAAVSAAPVLRDATLTTVVNTPGHAVSYRVD